MKTPICWFGQCAVHHRTDDTVDHYRSDDGVIRLAHQRSTGIWLAVVREAQATAMREDGEGPVLVGDTEIARRALDAALSALRRRVAADQRWLSSVDGEL